MYFTVQPDPVELEGAQRVVLRAEARACGQAESAPASVVLRNGARACDAIVERVEEGAAAVSLDKYLRIYLQARTGDALEVDFDSFPAGREVERLVPADYCRDALIGLARDFLLGKPSRRATRAALRPPPHRRRLGRRSISHRPGGGSSWSPRRRASLSTRARSNRRG